MGRHISTQRPSITASNPRLLCLQGKGLEVEALNLKKSEFLTKNTKKNNKCEFLLIGSKNQLPRFQTGARGLEPSRVKVHDLEKTVCFYAKLWAPVTRPQMSSLVAERAETGRREIKD